MLLCVLLYCMLCMRVRIPRKQTDATASRRTRSRASRCIHTSMSSFAVVFYGNDVFNNTIILLQHNIHLCCCCVCLCTRLFRVVWMMEHARRWMDSVIPARPKSYTTHKRTHTHTHTIDNTLNTRRPPPRHSYTHVYLVVYGHLCSTTRNAHVVVVIGR